MDCHDRSFVIAVDLSFAGDDARFEAVDGTGAYAVAEPYAAKCGYSVTVSPLSGRMELRASYFSCHTETKDDKVFGFSFNLLVRGDVAYGLNKTCSPSLEWAPREVSCELNYMEVSMKSEIPRMARRSWDSCACALQVDGWSTLGWQVVFQRDEEQLEPMSISDAREQGYMFALTHQRLVFRTPYGQPDSFMAMVNDIPVEVVHATLFSRQRWLVIMVDVAATCSMHQGAYEDSGHLVFRTPGAPYPGPDVARVRVGFTDGLFENGDVVTENGTVQISIPLDAKGGLRKSFVSDDLYEFYMFHLYLEQMFEDEGAETRLRLHRTLSTPMLLRPLFTQNQSIVEERLFQVYLGDVPQDVRLVLLRLNGREARYTNSCSVADITQPAHGHGYLLNVSFDHPAVTQQYYEMYGTVQYRLDINYTLSVLPENEPYFYFVSVTALAGPCESNLGLTRLGRCHPHYLDSNSALAPPVLDAACSESGISFSADQWGFGFLWSIVVGSDTLTPELAARRGYNMSNASQKLQLDVPVYSQGFHYKDITLESFLGTFEIHVKDRQTGSVQKSASKTCPFVTSELIVCSTDGRMTVAADLSRMTPGGASPLTSNLLDSSCGPAEVDETRALFSFPLNSCGSKVKLRYGNVIYRNEIFYSKNVSDSEDNDERLVVQCKYPLEGLHKLFSMYRFESDDPGIGSMGFFKRLAEGISTTPLSGLVTTTVAVPTPPMAGRSSSAAPIRKHLGSYPAVHYFRVSKQSKPHPNARKG
ncbi:LOW QUALITY PROTEIN: uncharacterized protein LOC119129636 [Syngnathus acus]|uniref:LOW QUALITY PROTEIN: uncharacterized protein LOC119129636 n=1 Tax=Syngnathus acus TaxID=161584 RepID=UPI001885E56C|nr:LOW QUALITY PROTEIN: uncharacterized protein LOC119129636 [Syngnathus acus]